MDKPKVIVIVGPTASGKTALGIALAKKIKGEIISCDSMQIYKKMDIGTAKPTKEEMQGIKHYLLDFLSPDVRYSVAQFQKDAIKAIEEIIQKGKIPILVGGTGLYVDSVIQGIEYPETNIDVEYRKQLEKQVAEKGLSDFYEKAKNIDKQAMEKISPNDKKRILRVIEIYHQTGKTKTQLEQESKKKELPYDYQVYGMTMERNILYQRIDKRVDEMIESGLIEEVKRLLKEYHDFPTAMQGLGYKEVVEYLKGQTTQDEMIEKIKRETRRYAKRQLTWFRRNQSITWLDGCMQSQSNVAIILEGIK